jgi:predicted O-methyltransferase YrrM
MYATTSGRRGPETDGTSTGTASGTIGVRAATGRAASAAASPHGSSRSAAAKTRRSRVRCHSPVAPGRLSAVGESKRTAHGTRGRLSSSAVVALETITARASFVACCARRAASPSTRSMTVIWRRSLPLAPNFTRTSRQLAPASLISSARASSARRRPSVVPSERRATSTVPVRPGSVSALVDSLRVPLPKVLRRATPDRIRHDVRLRAFAMGTGLIPPRIMHTREEADMLTSLARDRQVAVEIGVYEGSSALVLVRALPVSATLHLIDPFIDSRGLAAGWRGTAWASRRVVARGVRARGGPAVRWYVERSQDAGARWSEEVDLVFIDGDHAEETVRSDWEHFSRWVKPGGVVAFHDARMGKPGGEGLPGEGGVPGPTVVVDELFRGEGALPGWRVVADDQSLVAVERTAAG